MLHWQIWFQVTALSGLIAPEIQQIIDPQQLLFGGRVTAGSAVLEDTPARSGNICPSGTP
jgi:hypothetical protein